MYVHIYIYMYCIYIYIICINILSVWGLGIVPTVGFNVELSGACACRRATGLGPIAQLVDNL